MGPEDLDKEGQLGEALIESLWSAYAIPFHETA